MGDFNQVPTTAINPLISGETKKRGGLDFRVYQDLKTGIHRDLLNKIDLERVATVRDDRTRRQVCRHPGSCFQSKNSIERA
jgi:hypothetical protein